jgi:histone deacetylase HOS3
MNSLHSASGLTINTPTHRDFTRRPSSSLLTPSAVRMTASRPTSPDLDRKPLPTENSVAKEFFQADLKANHAPDSTRTSETVIILQKDVYGHRWERPNTTKSTLSTIVERPERIQAVTLGVSLAYVHNGGRHQDGKYQISPDLDASALQVPFQIVQSEKTLPLSAPAVANVHGAEWTKELQAMCEDAGAQLEKGSLETKPLKAKRLRDGNEFHEGDLYLNRESLKALEAALGATVEAIDRVCSPDSPTKRAFVAVRPPGHHCSSDWPSGFCWVNNVHVGIMHGFMNHDLTHAAIIDFDLHHGDGSQTLTVDHNVRRHNAKQQSASWKKSAIGYFSIHDINSYPCESGDWDKVRNASICIENAHAQNIWNVHLGEWKNELEFWYLYRTRYLTLLEKVRAFLRREADQAKASGQEPKAAIFLSAGFDASEYEMPGMQRHGVSVPTEFYARWTRDVVKMSVEEGLAVDGRVISCLEGGYSDRALYSGTFAHLSGLVGSEVRAKSDSNSVHSRRSTISSSDSEARIRNSDFPYDPTWWAPSELDTLEAVKAMPTPALRYAKSGTTPTYCSPTQASNARVSDFAKLRRSMSGTSQSYPTPPTEYERGPAYLPPPPPVYWPTAALELTKLLIPSDRVTVSMTWDEVKEQDKRIKKDRNTASSTAADTTANANGVRKSTRERKPAQHFVPNEDSNGRSRRRTLAGASDLAMEKVRSIADYKQLVSGIF